MALLPKGFQAIPRMNIIGSYASDAGRIECELLRYRTQKGEVVEWVVKDDPKATPLPGQPKSYADGLEAIDWFYEHFQDRDPEVHVE